MPGRVCDESSVGNLRLYTKLHAGQPFEEHSEQAIRFFAQDEAVRKAVQLRLGRLGSRGGSGVEGALFDVEGLQLDRPWRFVLLAVLPVLCLLLWPLLGAGVALFGAVGSLALNFFITLYLRSRTQGSFGALCSFATVLVCARSLAAQPGTKQLKLFAGLGQATARFKGIDLPITLLNSSNAMFQTGVPDPLSMLLVPVLCYIYIARRLQKHQTDARQVVELLGEVDLAIGVLSLRAMLPFYCAPEWTNEKRVTFDNLYHPLLEQPVANSGDFDRNILFTGSNASGKSTFVKAVAINCILGQSLGTCCARAFRLQRGRVFTSMAIQDDVLAGKSYFVAELESIRRLLGQAEAESFCYIFVDEILRGTNTVERISASCAVLRQLGGKNCFVMAATHDLELTRLLTDVYDNYHFRETVEGETVWFDYRLHHGPSLTRNAVRLMECMGYPAPLLQSAKRLVDGYETSGTWLAGPPQA